MVEQERVALKPERVIRPQVFPEEVGKYFLKSELGRVFPGTGEIRSLIDNRVDEINGKEFWRLLEAISFSYRTNYVFRYIGNSGFSWSEERWNISQLTLTGLNPDINAITFSPEIDRSPIKFRDFLRKYFNEHPGDDPQKLEQFRPVKRNVQFPRILLREDEGQILLLDGSNRLINLMLAGEEEIDAFVGRRNGKDEEVRIGDSTFILLKNLYLKGDEKEKAAVLKVVRQLMDLSSDGKSAIENYWIRHASDEEMKKVGRRILRRSNPKP